MAEVPELNGTVQIKQGGIYFTEKGSFTEFEVVAAKFIERRTDAMCNHCTWRLELGDGSTVAWTMDVAKYGMEFLAKELQDMPDERPKTQQTSSGYRFGIQNDELKETLLRLGNGIGDTVLPQYAQEIVTSSVEDFEFRILTIMYAEKKVDG